MPQKKVTRVEFPTKPLLPSQSTLLKRVAAYARVSTVKDAQENSLQSQQEYFAEYIRQHSDWVFAGMYTDDGVSGLSIRRRDGFNRMVNDALDGKIDLILTKSLSRFARNTVDALTTIRKLKAAGVAVYFQRENINTMDSTGEFLITLMSSFAEEESRSISENVTWAVRHRSTLMYRIFRSSLSTFLASSQNCSIAFRRSTKYSVRDIIAPNKALPKIAIEIS